MAYNQRGYYQNYDQRAHQQQVHNAHYPSQGIAVQIPRVSQYHNSSQPVPQHVYSDTRPQAQATQNHPQIQAATRGSTGNRPNVPDAKPQSKPAEASREEPEIDYAHLLISLAENYFDAAFGRHDEPQPSEETSSNDIYKLIATGLACLEAVLKQWTSALQPAVEAAVRLRYAFVLFQETENHEEAEEALSKGITQCDRYKLYDMKYSMQHLLARISYAKSPRAAVKFLDAAIKNAEIEQHTAWLYALRFLRIALSLDMDQPQETLAALGQLKIILNTANSLRDICVVAAASAIEALTRITRLNSPDNIEETQRALARVRSAQSSSEAAMIPNISIMALFIDMACSLSKDDFKAATTQMKAMHKSLEELQDHPAWTSDGTFRVPLSRAATKARGSTQGAVIMDERGNSYLQLSWLPKDEIYTLGYMLSAAVTMIKNAQDRMAEKFLREAQVQLGNDGSEIGSSSCNPSRLFLRCQVQISLVFALCGRSAWSEAKKELALLKEKRQILNNSCSTSSIDAFILYLEGIICQGTGDTAGALSKFSDPILNIDSAPQRAVNRDLSLLATLNTILIIHFPSHPLYSRLPTLLSSIRTLDQSTLSHNMRGAYYLILSIAADDGHEILKTKENLGRVLVEAKTTANSQLTCIGLNFLTEKFFNGLVGDQSLKSARSAVNMAREQKSDLWTSVADGLLAQSLETQGMGIEAEQSRVKAGQLAARLPVSMQVEAQAGEGGWRAGVGR